MSEMVYMYGFGFGGPPGRNVTVHVTYGGATGSGANVSCTNGKKTFYGVTDANGNFTFKLAKGAWTITANKSGSTSTVDADITGDCTVNVSLFAATINVTYPAGSACTVTNGTTKLTAPDTSGKWKCVVPNAGTWTLKIGNGAANTVTVANGGSYAVNKWYLYKNGTKFVPFTVQANASFASSNISLNSATVSKTSLVTSTNKISIKKCSKLVFVINATSKGTNSPGANFGLSTTNEADTSSRVAYGTTTSTGSQTITASISSISGRYYVYALSWVINLTISQIYLEV